MQLSFSLSLPRDEVTVPIVRHLARDALTELGVESECVGDIELAVTEACTNVLKHALGEREDYEVRFDIGEEICSISVIDAGENFDPDALSLELASTAAESGRGVHLMRALVDDLKFVARPEAGTIVHLEKKLVLKPGALLEKLVTASV